MKKLVLAAGLTFLALPAVAEPSCSPGETVKPMWESIKVFEESGGVVVAVKINDGLCYEIYGTVEGANFEVFYDPKAGASWHSLLINVRPAIG